MSRVSHAIDLKQEQITSRIQNSRSHLKLKKSISRSQVARNIDGDDEFKNIAGQILTYNSKISLTKQKTRPRTDEFDLEKPFLKKSDKKKSI